MSDLVGNPNCWFSQAQAHIHVVYKGHGQEVSLFCQQDFEVLLQKENSLEMEGDKDLFKWLKCYL